MSFSARRLEDSPRYTHNDKKGYFPESSVSFEVLFWMNRKYEKIANWIFVYSESLLKNILEKAVTSSPCMD